MPKILLEMNIEWVQLIKGLYFSFKFDFQKKSETNTFWAKSHRKSLISPTFDAFLKVFDPKKI
jgi:hypothetical protein